MSDLDLKDPVLLARLRILWDDLDFVSRKLESEAWLSGEQDETRDELYVGSLWVGLETTLIKEINRQKNNLNKIISDITKPNVNQADFTAAWTRYSKAFHESQGILRECLEIIGTLAIRNKDLDQRILYVADELIRECLFLSTGDERYYLLVHGIEDTFTKTRSRIIRFRFPEWSIWDLPLAAHELGHVIFSETLELEKTSDEDSRILESFVQTMRDSLIGLEPEWNAQNQEGGIKSEEAERWAENRIYEFLADAFATYTLGPAYACSAILLRLDPRVTTSEGRPSDAQRAHLILSMLEWANSKQGLDTPYEALIKELRGYWNETIERVNPHGKLSPTYETWLKQFAEKFGDEAGYNTFRSSALYPASGEREGWQRAKIWANEWLTQINKKDNLSLHKTTSENLRDVLNATWLLRLQLVKSMKQAEIDQQARLLKDIQEAGQKLCHSIMDARIKISTHKVVTAPGAGG